MRRRALSFICFLLVSGYLLLVGQSGVNIYTSPTGSGTACSIGTPCSISQGISSFPNNTAGTIHVANGTITSTININKSGASQGARLSFVCDNGVGSATAALNQCKVTATGAIQINGNNIDVVGFDIGSNPNMAFCTDAISNGGTTGNSFHAIGNNCHDFGANVQNTGGIVGCPENGGLHWQSATTDPQALRNIVTRMGIYNPGPPGCNQGQAIYTSGSVGGKFYDNIVGPAPVGGIVFGASCGQDVANNDVIGVKNGIIFGTHDNFRCPGGVAGNNEVLNNYINAAQTAVFNVGGSVDCTTARPTLFSHNISPGSVPDYTPARQSCDTTTPNPWVHQAAASFFVSFANDGTGDYHLKAVSSGIGAGASDCVSGGICPSVPPADFAGTVWPLSAPRDVGAYVKTAAGVPIASLNPSPLNFGTVALSTSKVLISTLTNTGGAALTISGKSISGTNSGDYSETDNCGPTVAVGASCAFTVTFTPKAAGTRTANVTITDNATGSPHQLPLTGVGGVASITLTPATLAFGVVAPSAGGTSCSAAQSSTVANSGTVAVTVTDKTFTGANANQFTFGGIGSCPVTPFTLAAGGSCTQSAKFCPTTAGAKSGNLALTDSAPGSPHNIALTGTGGAATVTLLPSSFGFGSQQVGTTSAGQNFTLTNTGNITLTGIAVSVTGATSSFTQVNNCPTTLAASVSCTITAFFKPAATGALAANISVASSAASSPNTSALTGTGTAPNLVLAPQTINFGNVLVGATSASSPITLTNFGTAPATITSILTALPFARTHDCPASLAAGAFCTIQVTASPSVTGLQSGAITIIDSAPGSPHVAAVNVTGVTPVASLTPSSINFGSQPVGSATAAQNFTLANTGSGPMTFTISVAGTNPGDFPLPPNGCTSPMQAGQSCLIPATFKPTTSGGRSAILRITDSASGSPHDATLSGTGIVTAPAVCLNVTSIDFGPQPVGTTSSAKPTIVTNCGTANLTVSSVTPTGDFTQTNNCTTVAPQAFCTIQGKFAPTVSGARTGQFSIADNAANTPQIVTLQGFGTTTGATLAPSSLSFGNVTVGVISAGQTLTVVNTGNTSLTVNTPTVTGANAADFTFTGLCGTVAPQAQCTYSVFFTPSGAGARSGTFNQSFGGGVTTLTSSLSGTGVATAPAVTLAPTAIDFGNVQQGSPSATKSIQLSNSGTANLTITSILPTGANAADYTINNHCTGVVTPGQVCAVDVVCTPSGTGARTASITFTDNASDSPQATTLTCNGTAVPAPRISLSPSSLSFGSIQVGQTSAAQNVTATNIGNATLNFSSLAFGGSNPGDFAFNPDTSVTNIQSFPDLGGHPPACGSTAAWCWQWDAATGGSASATSSLVASPSVSGQARQFNVVTGNHGGLRSSIYFGLDNLDPTSTRWTYDTWFQISDNTQVQQLEFDFYQVVPNGDTIIHGYQCNFTTGKWQYTLRVGLSDQWFDSNVTCTRPLITSGAWHHAIFQYHHDAAGVVTYDSITLDGTLTAVVGASGTGNYAIGYTPIGLTLIQFQMNGASAGANSFTAYLDSTTVTSGGGNCLSLAAGASCSVGVNFIPTTAGARSATLVFASNAASSPDSATLSGTGVAGIPTVVLAVSNINFGNTTVGMTSGPAVFTLTNTGNATATGVTVTAGGDFSVTDNCGGSITAGSSCSATVRFSPRVLCGQTDASDNCISNVHLGQVTVVSNTSNSPQTVSLQGTAVATPPPPGPIVVGMGGHLVVGGHLQVGVQ